MATLENPNSDDNPTSQPDDHQQVMGPMGVPAQDTRTASATMNGVPPSVRRAMSGSDEAAYERALAGAHVDAGQSSQEVPLHQSDVRQDVRASGGPSFREPTHAPSDEGSRPLLPHATVEDTFSTAPIRATSTMGMWAPSPFPSPIATPEGSEHGANMGSSFVQQGAAAMRWFSRLGEYVPDEDDGCANEAWWRICSYVGGDGVVSEPGKNRGPRKRPSLFGAADPASSGTGGPGSTVVWGDSWCFRWSGFGGFGIVLQGAVGERSQEAGRAGSNGAA